MSSDEFRALMAGAGLNQSKAAKQIGVSVTTVSRWVNDLMPITESHATVIRERLQPKSKPE